MTKLKFLPVAALLLLILSVNVFAQDGDDKIVGKATARAESMRTEFNLTDAQYKAVYDLLISTTQKENALWTSGKSRMEMEAAKDQIHQDFYSSIKSTFTAEQFAKFDKPQTKKSIKEGAKWRSAKMQEDLNLTKKQTKSIYNLIVSTTTKQNKLNTTAKDKTELYEGRIKLDDDFYSKVQKILTSEQFEKFNKNHY